MCAVADLECVVLLPISAAATTAATAKSDGKFYCVKHFNAINRADGVLIDTYRSKHAIADILLII
jgi:hypothetical protein